MPELRNTVLAAAVAAVAGLWGGVVLGRIGDYSGPDRFGAGVEGKAAPVRSATAPRPGPDRKNGMAFQRLRIDTSGAQPRACLEFTRDLSVDPQIRYTDFLTIDPAAQVTAEVSGPELCLAGLPYQPDRQVTIRQGLPAKDGARTARDESFTLSFGDRPSFIGFAGNGTILPRSEADGLGIETVNVSKIKIEVLRVSDRILARQTVDVGEAIAAGSWNYWNFQEDGADVGTKVFEGSIDVPLKDPRKHTDRRNQQITTVFALGAALKEFKPGAYVVKVRDGSPGVGSGKSEDSYKDRPAAAHRWILYTDMALQTFDSASGLDVVVRTLGGARPMGGITLTLIAENNDELARVRTDGDGRGRFDRALMKGEGPLKAKYVMAYGPNGDFAALDLDRPTLDLSDRATGGRAAPGDVDAYMYTDRGIYRPGEVVRVSGLLRDAAGRSIENRQSVLIVTRPNGTVARRDRLQAAKEAGGIIKNVEIDKSAPRGTWRARLEVDGQTEPAGEVSFAVEDFVPQKLKVEVKADESPLTAGGVRPIDVMASFLYGAPGSGLPVEGEARLQTDPTPFPKLKDFHFGREEERFEEKILPIAGATTDGDGRAQLAFQIADPPETSLPLRAKVVATVFEPGGRTVREGFDIPVRLSNVYLGVKPQFESDSVAEGGTAAFTIIAVRPDGARVAVRNIAWTLVNEDWSYDWYLEDGTWKWRRTGRDIPISAGVIDVGAGPAAVISREKLEEGSYRLVLKDEATGARTSYRFHAGWGGSPNDSDTPDMVAVAPPTEPTKPGGMVRVQIKPPYAGEAQIVVATDRVLSMRTISVSAGGTSINLRADKDWGAGAYVLVTVMTKRDPGKAPVPRRAVGVAYAAIDMGARTIKVAMPEDLKVVEPRQRLDVPITLTGAPRGEGIRLTLAAVDEGILQLTKFDSPDPTKWYFGRKALGVGIRDDYGRLLNPNLAAPSIARQGGDQLGGEGLTVVPTKTVALWSGLVKPDKNGKAIIPLELPDFNGQLRLMVVAWSESALGAGSQPLTVRDKVVAELTLPRFLAPGDSSNATLLIDNVAGPSGAYVVNFGGQGAAKFDAPSQRFTLGKGQRQIVRVPLSSAALGLGSVSLSVDGPAGFKVTRRYDIESRQPFLAFTKVETQSQAPQASFTLTQDAIADFVAGGKTKAIVSYSNLRGLDPAPLLDVLNRYPYGCSEQLTSTTFPLLYANALAAAAQGKNDPALRARVQETVNKLLDRQSPDGAFGLWREGDRSASPWLGAYIVDFLRRAKADGYVVPQAPLDLAYKGLRSVARLDDFSSVQYDFDVYRWPGNNDSEELLKSRAAAYSLYVLAKGGQIDVGQLRYFHDAKLKDDPSPVARAQIAAALAYLGDRSRSRNAFKLAESALGYRNTGDYYQTPLRDLALVVALAAEAGENGLVERLAKRLEREGKDASDLMTQEQAALLIAADALLQRAGPVAISLNGGPAERIAPVTADAAAIVRGLAFKNMGSGPVWRTVTASGAPRAAPSATSSGFSVEKRVYHMDGARADLTKLTQGERVVVAISGAPEGQRLHPSVLVDLLPAGLEIESVLKPEDGEGSGDPGAIKGPFAWIGRITEPKVAEARDDRFVAAADLKGGSFTFAYVARAVTPGGYTMPGVQIEDMYRPGIMARSAVGRIVIAPSS